MSTQITMDQAVRAALQQPFDQGQIRQDVTRPTDGFQPKYVPITEVIKRLNEVFGHAWSFEVVGQPHWLWIQPRAYVIVHGRLTVWYWHENRQYPVVKEQFGQCMLSIDRATGMLTDPGYDLKAAASDALKKCATMLGIALELYVKDESPMQGLVRTGAQEQGSFPPATAYPAQPMVQQWEVDQARKVIQKAQVDEAQVCQYLQIQSLAHMTPQQAQWIQQTYGGGLRSSAA